MTTAHIIIAEDHNVVDGFGSAVAEMGCGILKRIGLKDTFAESGSYNELLQKYEMDSNYILKMADELLTLS